MVSEISELKRRVGVLEQTVLGLEERVIQPMQALAEAIDRLEKTAAQAVGDDGTDVVRARKLEVVDERGDVVISLASEPTASVTLFNRDGSPAAVLAVDKHGGAGCCSIQDARGRVRVSLGVDDGNGRVVTLAADGDGEILSPDGHEHVRADRH